LIVLEPLAAEHEAALAAAARFPEVWELVDHPGHEPDGFASWFARALDAAAAGREAPFATVARDTGEVVGASRFLELRPEHRGLEIGWTWLAPSRWGTGFNVEAKLLMMRHAFETLGCARVELKTDARNARSRGAMAALPARFEGIHRKHRLLSDGSYRDSAWYSVIDDDWPEVRANLERRLRETSPS
jgi:RimJ/RimL family protein N-acetyltransferase